MPAAAAVPFSDLRFCVVDVEATGLSPDEHRIIELAALVCDVHGRVLVEVHSLVDPGVRVDGSWIHGIEDDHLVGAPSFADLAAPLLALMDGAVLVGHNISFDLGFLNAEMERAGKRIGALPRICTMYLRRQVGLTANTNHTLQWACEQEGIALESAHAAMCDVRASGALLASYLHCAAGQGAGRLGDIRAGGRTAESWQALLPTFPRPVKLPRLQPRHGVSPKPERLWTPPSFAPPMLSQGALFG